MPLSTEIGLDGFNTEAVRLDGAISAPFANRFVDEGPYRRVGKFLTFAASTLLGCTGLIVNKDRRSRQFTKLALNAFQLVPVMHGDARSEADIGWILVRLIGHDADRAHA